MRIFAVDPGEKRIGLAVSDESGTIANPLGVLAHVSRKVDVASVVTKASEVGAQRIIIGQSFDEEGLPNAAGRRAQRFADELSLHSNLPVELWDEAFTTQDARTTRISMGVSRKKRSGHLDDLAATILLQSYLDHLNL